MGGFDFDKPEYDPPKMEGNYLEALEKAVLVKNGTPITVRTCVKNKGKFGWRYLLNFDLEGEDRILQFSAVHIDEDTGKATGVQARDDMLDDLAAYFEAGGEPETIEMYHPEWSNKAVLIRKASA